jgi:hypothetical protein
MDAAVAAGTGVSACTDAAGVDAFPAGEELEAVVLDLLHADNSREKAKILEIPKPNVLPNLIVTSPLRNFFIVIGEHFAKQQTVFQAFLHPKLQLKP